MEKILLNNGIPLNILGWHQYFHTSRYAGVINHMEAAVLALRVDVRRPCSVIVEMIEWEPFAGH